MCLAQALVLEGARRLEVGRRVEVRVSDLGLLLAEPALLDELVDVDEQRVARKGRRGLVRRIAEADRAERQDLPDVLARFFEEVDEAVCLLAEVADTVFRRQRRRVQQDASLMLVTVLRRDVLQEEALERQQCDRQLAVLDREARLGMEGIGKDAVREVANLQRDGLLLLEAPVEERDEALVLRGLAEDIAAAAHEAREGHDVALGVERQELACLQGRVLIAHADHALVTAPDVRVAVLPIVGAAVVRVLEALHRDLIAVVDARDARVRHLPERRHEEARHAEIVLVVRQACARLLDGRHAVVERLLAEHRDGALHIVTADEVHHRVEILTRVILAQALEAAQAHPGIRAAEQEVKEDLAERVVHGRVHLLAAEVLARHTVGDLVRRILPDLANHDSIGIRLLELREEGLREGCRQLVDDVEAPARDALLHPVVHDAVLIVDDEVHVGWRRLLDVRQRGEIPPALVLVREVAEVVPLVVGRIRRLERANRIVLALAVEVAAVAARMAEDTVEDDADALRLRRVDEMAEVLVRAEDRVDLMVIACVVVMVALRLKDRVQVDD